MSMAENEIKKPEEQEVDVLAYQPPPAPSLKEHAVDFFQTLVVFAAIGTVIYLFVAQPHKVSGNSMFPNFHNADYIITDKVSYRFSLPQRGDVVVFKNPKDPSQDFIKRVIGLPGEKVKVQGGKVYINGKILEEPYLKPEVYTTTGAFLQEGKEMIVNEGSTIVMGDNRPNSSDSREWGLLPNEKIIGRVILRYFPPPDFGLYPEDFKNYNI